MQHNQPTLYRMQICSKGVWDSTVPGIGFDENGISNYARMFEKLVDAYPRGEKGLQYWEAMVQKIKKHGKGKRYDCIIGVSGGTDSCYLMHLAVQYGLRPLAVNLDNGWNTDIAVRNIKAVTAKLNIDLETYVIDYEEIKDLLRAYMRASLPWIDIPTDIAIKSVLYRIARREKIKFILRGNDFRSEGTQPREWTYGDGRQLRYIHRKFGSVKLKTFPNYTLFNLLYNGFLKGIKSIYPFYFLEYHKAEAQELLKKNYGWEYYGGHHHENIFTKFAISYWLLRKFNIDKRKITFSAQIMSGQMNRRSALEILSRPPASPEIMEQDKVYTLKKLDISEFEFEQMLLSANKNYQDYPSYYPIMQRFTKTASFLLRLIQPNKPMAFFQMEMRDKNEKD